jgi:hypothetical protein
MMQKAVIGFLAVLFFFSLVEKTTAQYVFPTPTPTPKASPTPAPAPGPAPCPTVNVQAPGQPIRDGQKVTFTANIAGGDPKAVPMIIWNTSAGAITQGNNTRRIEVDTTGAGSVPDREVRAEVWIGGYAPECLVQAAGIAKIIAPASKFGEFGEVDEKTFKSNMEQMSTFLSQSPDNLFLIGYAGRKSERGFTNTWLRRMKDALVMSGISARRIVAMDGGFREQPMFDFWIVPIGAEPPRPTPTVRRDEIVYPNTRPVRRPQ